MKSKGGTARAGDVISYIFCLGTSGESSKTGQADKARHPDEVRKAENDCQIGVVLVPSHAPPDPLTFHIPGSQITIIIWPNRYYHRLKGCARELRELIGRGLPNASVRQHSMTDAEVD